MNEGSGRRPGQPRAAPQASPWFSAFSALPTNQALKAPIN